MTARSSANASATGAQPGSLPAENARQAALDEAEPAELLESLPELGEERPGRDGRDDRVRQLPAELLGDLEGERLRAFRVVRAQVHVDERPVELTRKLDDSRLQSS